MEMTWIIVLCEPQIPRQDEQTHISGNVSRDITTLGLDNGESSERSSTELVVHLGGTLEETRVQVEDITGVSLTTGGTTEQKGHLTVSNGLLGQVVVDDKSCNKR